MKQPTFPPHAALVNAVKQNAFAMRFVTWMDFSNTLKLKPADLPSDGIGLEAMSRRTSFQVCDAGLLLAPYVRIGKMPKKLAERVRQGRISMWIDGYEIFIGKHLWKLERDPDGRISEEPWYEFKARKEFFWGVKLDQDTSEASGDPADAIGIFLPHDSHLKVDLYGLPKDDHDGIEVDVGMIMGKYTTKVEAVK